MYTYPVPCGAVESAESDARRSRVFQVYIVVGVPDGFVETLVDSRAFVFLFMTMAQVKAREKNAWS